MDASEAAGDDGRGRFVAEEVQQQVTEVIGQVIGGSTYSQSDVGKWSSAILEQSLSSVSRIVRGYKLVVTCVLMQKSGAGLSSASACFWDATTDTSCTTRWENKSVSAIVHLFAIAI